MTHTQLSTPPKFKSGTEQMTIPGCHPSFFQWWITTIFYTVSDYIWLYMYIILLYYCIRYTPKKNVGYELWSWSLTKWDAPPYPGKSSSSHWGLHRFGLKILKLYPAPYFDWLSWLMTGWILRFMVEITRGPDRVWNGISTNPAKLQPVIWWKLENIRDIPYCLRRTHIADSWFHVCSMTSWVVFGLLGGFRHQDPQVPGNICW